MSKTRVKSQADLMFEIKGGQLTILAKTKSIKRIGFILCVCLLIALIVAAYVSPELWKDVLKVFLSMIGSILASIWTGLGAVIS